MRTAVPTFCPFGRDVSWITQEIIESYAGICLRDNEHHERDTFALCDHQHSRVEILQSILHNNNLDFVALKNELLEEYGKDYFKPVDDRHDQIFILQQLLKEAAKSKDHDAAVKLSKELRELRGWVEKPREAGPAATVNVYANAASTTAKLDRSNPRELERFYQSMLG